MGKWCGKIGYVETVETSPGIFTEQITEKFYSGDVTRNVRKFQSGDKLNDNIDISNEISIVADPFAYDNFRFMRYIEFMGAKWKITNIEVRYPRLILTIGGVFNV
jgi:predicted nuclease of restriction endonuclease-like (RecB) superfamily